MDMELCGIKETSSIRPIISSTTLSHSSTSGFLLLMDNCLMSHSVSMDWESLTRVE